ncbi:MAG TPA: hypothetical protein VGK10_06595 [Prolixibacteraceae bacterium]|jgi:hypothetical protein
METHRPNSSKEALQSFGLAMMAVVAGVTLYVSVVLDGLVEPEIVSGPTCLFIFGLVNALCCFFLVRHSPLSIWYVPLLLNVFGIVVLVMEPDYMRSALWLPVCGGSLLCIIASIAGAVMGNKTNISQHPDQGI